MHACSVAQSCLTLYNSVDCSPPGSSVRGVLQTGLWSGLPCPLPEDLSDPEIESLCLVSCVGITSSATWEALNLLHWRKIRFPLWGEKRARETLYLSHDVGESEVLYCTDSMKRIQRSLTHSDHCLSRTFFYLLLVSLELNPGMDWLSASF